MFSLFLLSCNMIFSKLPITSDVTAWTAMRPEDYGTMVLRYVVRYALVKKSREREGKPDLFGQETRFLAGNSFPDGNPSARYAAR